MNQKSTSPKAKSKNKSPASNTTPQWKQSPIISNYPLITIQAEDRNTI